jgi:hypothetical protein
MYILDLACSPVVRAGYTAGPFTGALDGIYSCHEQFRGWDCSTASQGLRNGVWDALFFWRTELTELRSFQRRVNPPRSI